MAFYRYYLENLLCLDVQKDYCRNCLGITYLVSHISGNFLFFAQKEMCRVSLGTMYIGKSTSL